MPLLLSGANRTGCVYVIHVLCSFFIYIYLCVAGWLICCRRVCVRVSCIYTTAVCMFTPRCIYSYVYIFSHHAGDAVCQGLETFDTDTELAWDHARTIRMGITGAFVTTPASFTWNLYAERIAPGTSLRAVMTKLAVSIAVFPPMVRESKRREHRRGEFFSVFVLIAVKKLPWLYVCDTYKGNEFVGRRG